ncbi:MAG: alpha-N-arabinofuranosidase, partial [Lachnospiraceae bacterium]|nr:alpha-N-arabinofuranosidase [Lachnospiraceae bacterium]
DGKDGDEEEGYIANMKSGAEAGFKYFDCRNVNRISVVVRGGGLKGELEVMTAWDGEVIGQIPVRSSNEWKTYEANVRIPDGVWALYFRYRGEKAVSLKSLTLYTG